MSRSKKNKNTEVKTEEATHQPSADNQLESGVQVKLKEVLDKSEKYTQVMVISLDANGNIDIDSTINTVPGMSYVLNRSVFELNIFEMNERNKTLQE